MTESDDEDCFRGTDILNVVERSAWDMEHLTLCDGKVRELIAGSENRDEGLAFEAVCEPVVIASANCYQ